MASKPTSYDDAVFRQALRKRARFNAVTTAQVVEAFWEASPELLDAIHAKGGDAMVEEADRRILAT